MQKPQLRGRITWFDDSPGIGGVRAATEFVSTAVFGLDEIKSYVRLEPRQVRETRLCRISRVGSDRVDVTFAEPDAVALGANSFLLIQGPHPIARIDVSQSVIGAR